MALIDRIKQEEGFRSKPYKDSVGVLTIGYGTNLDEGIDDVEATFLLQHRLDRTADAVEKAIPWVVDLDKVRFEVLVDMAYNMGVAGLMQFHRTLAMVEAKNFDGAASAMLESKWAAEVGHRAVALSEMMRTGVEK